MQNQPERWREHLPRPQAHQHKYSRGAALVYGGNPLVGAARLSALACARSGAGATTIACDPVVWPIYAQSMLSIMVQAWSSADQAWRLAQDSTYEAILIGPGMTPDASAHSLVLGLLAQAQPQTLACVLDAGALMAFKEQPAILFDAINAAAFTILLTPHEGEFERLFPDLNQKNISLTKTERAQEAAQRSGAIVLLKGSDTVIASPQGALTLQSESSPYLATAGSGDVLAGIITGLLAQGVEPFAAASMAVWVHSQTGLRAGAGLIAEDLLLHLPAVWQDLLST